MLRNPPKRKGRPATRNAIGRTVSQSVNPTAAVDRVLASWDTAAGTPAELDGRAFYPKWHAVAVDLAAAYGVPTLYGSAAIAALSPRMPAGSNLACAIAATAGRWNFKSDPSVTFPPLDECRAKAMRILIDRDPCAIGFGAKTRSFSLNIGRPYCDGPITLDVWSMSLLYGRHLSDSDLKVLDRRAGYVWHAGLYRTAARIIGAELGHTVQSVTWHETRIAAGADWRDRLAEEDF